MRKRALPAMSFAYASEALSSGIVSTPFGQGPQFIIRDRDDKFRAVFDRVAKGIGIRVLRAAGSGSPDEFGVRAISGQAA